MKRIPTILLCVVVAVLSAFGALWLDYELAPQESASTDFLTPRDPDLGNLRPITDEQAVEHWRKEKPHRRLRIVEFLYRPWWDRTSPLDALTQMEGMKGNGAEVGGFKGALKSAATVPGFMAIAGIGALLAAGLLLWRGKPKMALAIAIAGGALLVGAAAFEATPWLAPVIVGVAALAVLLGVAVSTKAGQQVLERLGIRDRQIREVVNGGSGFLEALSKQMLVKDATENTAIIGQVSELFIAEQKGAQDGDTQQDVKAMVKGG